MAMLKLRVGALAGVAAIILCLLATGGPAWSATAYLVPAGTAGNQGWGGPLGMDFNVNSPIAISELGIFDDYVSGSHGLSGSASITASIFDRSTARQLASLTFTSANPGTLVGGSRFQTLPVPLILPAGFQGSVVAKGFSAADQNGNSLPAWTTDSGGGLISFVGTARYGNTGDLWPGAADNGPANRYAAGTFNFGSTAMPPAIEIGRPVTVANPSFELPGYNENGFGNPTSWTPSQTINAGSFNPPTGGMFSQPIPSGGHMAFVNNGHSLTSDSLGKLEPNTLYVVQAEWGVRSDSPNAKHAMYLLAGGVEMGYINNQSIMTGPTVPDGEWRTARGYFTANHNAAIGADLSIRLANGGLAGNGQSVYDNVRMTKVSECAVPIVNPSFESPNVNPPDGWSNGATGWTVTGSGGAYEDAGQIIPADGSQSAWVGINSSLTQTLAGYPARNGTRYILLADVADRASTTFSGYKVELLAGGQVIGVDNNSYTVLGGAGTGYFYTTSVVDVFFDSPLGGQDLGIRLSALGSGNQTYFDNVRLFAVEIPEPASMILLGLAAASLSRYSRRRRAA